MRLSRNKIILVLVILLALGGFLTFNRLTSHDQQKETPKAETPTTTNTETAEIVSTNPDPLDEAFIPADHIIEITFNKPLRNPDEFKAKITPEADVKIELSEDRKTARIIPNKPYELGTSYGLYIGYDTKFDGIDRWGKDITYNFKTIKFRGL